MTSCQWDRCFERLFHIVALWIGRLGFLCCERRSENAITFPHSLQASEKGDDEPAVESCLLQGLKQDMDRKWYLEV